MRSIQTAAILLALAGCSLTPPAPADGKAAYITIRSPDDPIASAVEYCTRHYQTAKLVSAQPDTAGDWVAYNYHCVN